MDQNRRSSTSNISKTTTILKCIREQKFSEKNSEQYTLFILFLYGPFSELHVRSLKLTCTDISGTVRNFWTVVEQEMYKITRTFFWYQAEGPDPLKKGSRMVQITWRISLELLKYFVIDCWRGNAHLNNLDLAHRN